MNSPHAPRRRGQSYNGGMKMRGLNAELVERIKTPSPHVLEDVFENAVRNVR